MSLTIPTNFGVIASGAPGGGGGGSGFVLKNEYGVLTAGNNVFSWTGAQAGDLVIVCCLSIDSSYFVAPAGWGTSVYGPSPGLSYYIKACTKVLTAADITAGSGTWSNCQSGVLAQLFVYRGALSAPLRTAASSTTSSLAIPGITKAAQIIGLFSYVEDQDDTTPPLPGTPAGWTARSGSSSINPLLRAVGADLLTPASYTNGNSVTWTGFDTTYENNGVLLELLNGYATTFPAMTSNTAPIGYVASASDEGVGAAYLAFDATGAGTFWGANTTPATLRIQFPTPRVVSQYTLRNRSGALAQMPRTWTVQGSNDASTWTSLDARTLVPAWADSEARSYTIASPGPYLYYQIIGTNPDNPTITVIAQWSFTFSAV